MKSNIESNGTIETASSERGHLVRVMGFWDLVFFGIVFMFPTIVLSYLGSTQITSRGHSFLAFLIGCLFVIFTSMSYSKMIQVYPSAGSAYTYVSKTFNPKVGFVVGWTLLLDYVLTPLFLFVLFGLYMARIAPIFPFGIWLTLAAGVTFIINLLGLKLEKYINTSIFTFQIIGVVLFSVLSTIYITKNDMSLFNPYVIYHQEGFSMDGVMGASTLAVLSCLGFDGISTIAEESKIEAKKIGSAVVTSVVIQAICLCLLAYVASLIFPDYTKILHPDTINVDLQDMVGGKTYSFIMVLITQIFYLATSCVCITSGSRLLFSMGRDNVIPNKIFGYIGRFNTPAWAITIICFICYIGGFILNWEFIASVVAFGAMIAFLGVNLCVIVHYFIREKQRNVITNLIFPMIGFLGILFVLINSAVECKAVGFTWLGAGVIYLLIRSATSKEFRDTINRGLDM